MVEQSDMEPRACRFCRERRLVVARWTGPPSRRAPSQAMAVAAIGLAAFGTVHPSRFEDPPWQTNFSPCNAAERETCVTGKGSEARDAGRSAGTGIEGAVRARASGG